MANHKRKKPKSRRAGCIYCKSHKHQAEKDAWNNKTGQDKRASVSEREYRDAVSTDE